MKYTSTRDCIRALGHTISDLYVISDMQIVELDAMNVGSGPWRMTFPFGEKMLVAIDMHKIESGGQQLLLNFVERSPDPRVMERAIEDVDWMSAASIGCRESPRRMRKRVGICHATGVYRMFMCFTPPREMPDADVVVEIMRLAYNVSQIFAGR